MVLLTPLTGPNDSVQSRMRLPLSEAGKAAGSPFEEVPREPPREPSAGVGPPITRQFTVWAIRVLIVGGLRLDRRWRRDSARGPPDAGEGCRR